MARKHFTPEQIINMLREAGVHFSQNITVAQVCKKMGILEQSYYRWRKEYGGLRHDPVRRLKRVEREPPFQEASGLSFH